MCNSTIKKLKVNYRPGFNTQRTQDLSEHPPSWTLKKALSHNSVLVT